MKVKVSEASGPVLDWMVAKCAARKIGFNLGGGLEVRGRTEDGEELPDVWDLWMPWHPSTDWVQGGPILERDKIGLGCDEDEDWYARPYLGDAYSIYFGLTPLIAAMRCYVVSKLGKEVEVPDALSNC